jgi:uncharacterized protein (DUF433 family)
MDRDQLLHRVSVDPQVSFGRPCIRGTRVWVSLILDNLSDGVSVEELLRAYPQLVVDDVHAALAYASALVQERIIPVPVEPAHP